MQEYRGRAGAMFGFGAAGGAHGGAVADLLAVPAADHMLVAAPSQLSDTALATLPDNVIDGYRCVGPPLGERPGSDVLVVGGAFASIGLYAAAIAVALGAASVRYFDHDERRCAAAAALGAVPIHRDGEWPRKLPSAGITVDGSGVEQGLACTLRSTEPYGLCTSASIFFTETTSLPMLEMYTRGITLHTSRADSRRFLPEILHLTAAGGFDPLAVPTTIASWDDAATAWMEPATKLVLVR